MPRELRPELQTLIDSRHCNWATAIDIVLTSGIELHLSSSEIPINRFGILRSYLAKLRDIQPCNMSIDPTVDGIDFKIANVDKAIGQTLTGDVRELDGARATRGVIFIDPTNTVAGGQHMYDPTLSGELVASEVSDENAPFSLISDVDSVIIAGRTIASEFQWREPVSVAPINNPSDIPPGSGIIGSGGGSPGPIGRYGELDPLLGHLSF